MGRVLSGDRAALVPLVERHHAPLTGYLYRLCAGDYGLAEDLTQEAFVRLLKRSNYAPNRPFKPWLYAIATNLVRDHFRSAAARHETRLGDLEPQTGDDEPEIAAVGMERRTDVADAVGNLPEHYRSAVILRFYQGFSLLEIATTLGIPLGTVKSRLSTGIRQLHAVLQESWGPAKNA